MRWLLAALLLTSCQTAVEPGSPFVEVGTSLHRAGLERGALHKGSLQNGSLGPQPEGGTTGPIQAGTTLTTPNGSYAADACYDAVNAAYPTWTATVGSNLSESGSGTDQTLGATTPYTDGTVANDLADSTATNCWGAAGAFQIGSGEDFAVRAVFKVAAGGTNGVFGLRNTGAGSYTQIYTSGAGRTLLADTKRTDGTNKSSNGGGQTTGDWLVVHLTGRSGGEINFYKDGTQVDTDADTATGGIGDGTEETWVSGATNNGCVTPGAGFEVAHVCMWAASGMFSSSANQDTTASDDYDLVQGN